LKQFWHVLVRYGSPGSRRERSDLMNLARQNTTLQLGQRHRSS